MSSPPPSLRFTAAVLTASDRCFRGEQVDRSGPAVARVLTAAGFAVVHTLTLPDEAALLSAAIRDTALLAALVVTTGGTGLAPRDVTPEATLAVCDRLVPGLAELMRAEGLRSTPFAALSRAVCGVCAGALVLNLPGSPAGAESSLHSVLPLLPHALHLLGGQTDHSDFDSPHPQQP